MALRRALQVWVLSDGLAGHYNQSRGIVEALRRVRAVDERWINVELRLGLCRNLLRAYLNHSDKPSAAAWLRLCYKIDKFPDGVCDLLVSAGGKTSFANAYLAGSMGVANVYSGSLRGLSADLFRLVLTLEPLAGAAGNLVLPLAPSYINAERVNEKRQQYRDRLQLGQQRCWSLLIGGDGAGYRYQLEDWDALAASMVTLSSQYGVKWLVASSRRTGRNAERRLKDRVEHSLIAAQCWSGSGDDYDPELYLGVAEKVFVTEDSMTMMTEAAYALRPVYSLRPRQAQPNSRYCRMLDGFVKQGFLCRLTLEQLAADPQPVFQCNNGPLLESPLSSLGKHLAERLKIEPA